MRGAIVSKVGNDFRVVDSVTRQPYVYGGREIDYGGSGDIKITRRMLFLFKRAYQTLYTKGEQEVLDQYRLYLQQMMDLHGPGMFAMRDLIARYEAKSQEIPEVKEKPVVATKKKAGK